MEAELEVAKLQMLRYSLRVIRLDTIRNKHIRGTSQVEAISGTKSDRIN